MGKVEVAYNCGLLLSPTILISRAQLFEGRLALNPGSFFICSKVFSQIIFSVIFRASKKDG